MRAAEADMLRQQLSQTDSHQITVDVKSLKERKDDLIEKVKTCEITIKEGQQKVCVQRLPFVFLFVICVL